MEQQLKKGMIVKTVYGEWVWFIEQLDSMVVVESATPARSRGLVHASKLMPSTAKTLYIPVK